MTNAPIPLPPAHWRADVLASDGGVVALRPIEPSDAERIVAFHAGLSERTRYLRYFGPYPQMSERDLRRTTHVDYQSRVAFVMLLGEQIVAIGLYEGLDGASGRIGEAGPADPAGPGPNPAPVLSPPTTAEVAFVVADAHQGRGLGSILLEHLARAGSENGIEVFVAEVLSENRAMIKVFRDAGYQVKHSMDGAVAHLEFAIDPTMAQVQVRNSRERTTEARSVGNLLNPRTVAVIGASAELGKVGWLVMVNLLGGGFTGAIFPVNRARVAVLGLRAYPSVREIPGDVDLAVVAVPAAQIDSVLDDCLAKNVKGMVVLSAGFAETGPAGLELQRRLVERTRGHGMRLVGPNAAGIANTDPAVGLNATLAPRLPGHGPLGFFCQTGSLSTSILHEAATRNLGMSTFVSAGNRADLSGNDVLQFWDSDPDTSVVLLYLETVGNPRKFSRITQRVSRSKPVIMVRSAIAGSAFPGGQTQLDAAVAADLFAQSGIIAVDSVSDLFDTAALAAYQPLPAGPRVAVITNGAVLGWMATAAAKQYGLRTRDPVLLGPEATGRQYAAALRKVGESRHIDALVVIVSPPVVIDLRDVASAIREAVTEYGKPVIAAYTGLAGIVDELAVLDDDSRPTIGSVPSFSDPERAVAALARMWRYAHWREQPNPVPARPPGLDAERAGEVVASVLAALNGEAESRWLSDLEAVAVLSGYGVDVVEFRLAATADEAVSAAQALGGPVAVKATGQIWRNSPDLQGVRLDISDADAVRRAYAEIVALTGEQQVHVQRMAPRGIGVVVRVRDHSSFGSVISFGLAGPIIELLGDRVHMAIPLSEEQARDLIDAPKAAPLLDGGEGREPVDKTALAQLLVRISALCDDVPQIRELECEPVLASARGAAVIYARIRIGPEPRSSDSGPRSLALA